MQLNRGECPRFQPHYPLVKDRAASGRRGLVPLTSGATPPVPAGGGAGGAGQRGVGAIASAQWHRSGGLWPFPRLQLPGGAGGGGGGGQGVHGAGRRTRHPPSSWAALHARTARAVCCWSRGVTATPPPPWMCALRCGAHAATSVGRRAAVSGPPVEEAQGCGGNRVGSG